MELFSASVDYDKRLYLQDIQGSIAHARMLSKCGILSPDEFQQIEQGLLKIQGDIEQDRFDWSIAREDVHMNIEAALTEDIGEPGKKLHTARSRNDQIATDLRLYLRQRMVELMQLLTDLQRELVAKAASHADTIMPGFTHMQSAQPVTFGHHLLAWNEMLERDFERMTQCRDRLNQCPLGSAALAGTGFAIDREMTAKELGFHQPCLNSLDAVSDRDFAIEFAAVAAMIMVHLSRMSEELVLWSSDAWNFVDLGEGFCTGSSIMPQKKNPDMAELTRGKSARAVGNLNTLLVLMKSQPLAYNRDNQEDKEPLFDTLDNLHNCLSVFTAMVPGLTANKDRMYAAASNGFATATDLADYLVGKGVAFRDAHEIVGNLVRSAAEKQCALSDLDLSEMQESCAAIQQDVYTILTLEGSVNSRNHIGGTAPEQVKRAAEAAGLRLQQRILN